MSDLLNNREKKIKVLQQNLSAIRKIAGWTTEQLGEKIGVTKQTISNLENNKSPMNFTQYIAIRAVLDCEIEEHPENKTLPKVVELLLDHSDELDDDDYQKVTESISTVAAAASGGVTGSTLEDLFSGLILPFLKITGIALLGPAGLVATLSPIWLKKLLDKNDKKQ